MPPVCGGREIFQLYEASLYHDVQDVVGSAHADAHGLGQVKLLHFGTFLKEPQDPEARVFWQLSALASHQSERFTHATASGMPLPHLGFKVLCLKRHSSKIFNCDVYQ